MGQIKVAVVGAAGRMGTEVGQILLSRKNFSPELDIYNSTKNKEFKTHSKLGGITLKGIDVLIDFTNPEICLKIAELAAKNKIPMVTGTTGLTEKNFKTLKDLSKKTAILWSPNMSLGVAALRKSLKSLEGLEGFDFQIIEHHHNKKLDSPSGTAKLLQKDMEQIIAPKKMPPVLAMRSGGIVGLHQVFATSEDEQLLFQHNAMNRRIFAAGAVAAAQWIIKKKPGFYSLESMFD